MATYILSDLHILPVPKQRLERHGRMRRSSGFMESEDGVSIETRAGLGGARAILTAIALEACLVLLVWGGWALVRHVL